jgi:hypothetical protein
MKAASNHLPVCGIGWFSATTARSLLYPVKGLSGPLGDFFAGLPAKKFDSPRLIKMWAKSCRGGQLVLKGTNHALDLKGHGTV